MSDLKKAIIKGAMWSVLGQMASLLVTLATNIWLARLLSPKEFGQVGIIMFFIVLANVLTESGLGGALVRKKNASRSDYSTVFVTNLVFSILCYIVLVLATGAIAAFYKDVLLKNLLITASIVIIINAFELTQNAKLISEMKFKEQSIYRFISVLISSSIGIYLVYKGLGVWALVFMQIMTAGINTIILWFFEGFFLSFHFSKKSFKELYCFGLNTTLSSLLNTAFDNIYLLVLGRYFSISQTGLFYQAKKLQDIPGGVMNTVIQSVVFSSLAKLQDDKVAFSKAYNKINLYFLVLLGFICTFIYIYADAIIFILFGSKWLGAVFYMKLLTVASFFYIQEQINRVIFKVFNQTRKILILELVKKMIQAVSIVVGVYVMDLKVLILGFILTNLIGYLINFYYSRKIMETGSSNEMFNLLKVIVVCSFSIIFILYIIDICALDRMTKIYTVPLLMFIYLLCVHFLKVLNIITEIQNILTLSRKIN